MKDARFEDAAPADRPLRLKARTEDDLAVISSLVQDAVGTVGDVCWAKTCRRLVVMMNRFRWEDRPAAEQAQRPYERVRTALTLENVLHVRSNRVDPADRERVYALLAIGFEPEADGPGGTVALTLAGGGVLAAEVEALEASLADLTRPWEALAARCPDHGV